MCVCGDFLPASEGAHALMCAAVQSSPSLAAGADPPGTGFETCIYLHLCQLSPVRWLNFHRDVFALKRTRDVAADSVAAHCGLAEHELETLSRRAACGC